MCPVNAVRDGFERLVKPNGYPVFAPRAEMMRASIAQTLAGVGAHLKSVSATAGRLDAGCSVHLSAEP